MVFAAAGGIDHEELFQLLSDAFGDLPIIPQVKRMAMRNSTAENCAAKRN